MRLGYLIDSLGVVISCLGFALFSPAVVGLIYKDYNSAILFSSIALVTLIVGYILHFTTPSKPISDTKKNEAMAIVLLSWIVFWLISSVPYLFYGLAPINALFEGVSGVSSCGATILVNFDYPKAFFFWRSITQWFGGMGIIILFTAILPQFAIAGRQMFNAEAPGPTEEKLTPRIRYTATALWGLYVLLTVLEVVLLIAFGMNPFDAICNAFSTISAGGFSPNAYSIGGYGSTVCTWICIVFMFIAGCNFALLYRAVSKAQPSLIFKNEEFKFFFSFVAFICFAIVGVLFLDKVPIDFTTVTNAIFSAISVMTSTGFATYDFSLWSVQTQMLLFCTILIGSCAGSCGGGLKISRVIIVLKYLKREIIKILHPNAVLNIKVDNKLIPIEVVQQVMSFVMFYVLVFFVSAILVTLIENDLAIGLSGSISTLGLVGPGLGSTIGPLESYNHLSNATKLIFMFNMLIGRLEVIPFLVLFNKDFWKIAK